MSDGQTLYLILLAVYLFECCHWVSKETIVFSSFWGSKWYALEARKLFGSARGSMVFTNPLPPLGKIYLAHLSPISISPGGICATWLHIASDGDKDIPRGMAFDAIADVQSDGKYLSINGSHFARCATDRQADVLAGLIRDIASKPQQEREKVISDFMKCQFSLQAASTALTEANRHSAALRLAGMIFFVILYIAVPVLMSFYGLILLIIPTACLMIAYALLISLMFRKAHKAVYPESSKERAGEMAKMALFPPAAIRAADLITLDAISDFHPILLAALFKGPKIESFIRSFVRDMKYPLRSYPPESRALQIAEWYDRLQLNMSIEFLNIHYPVSCDEIFLPPMPDGASIAYCPRCRCQFTSILTECPDCPGVEPLAFPNTLATGNV